MDNVESGTGDVTVPDSVEQAMAGCDAVLHAAAVCVLDPRAASRMRETNVRATENILGTAVRMGLDPIVHVSSFVALLPPDPPDAVLTPDSRSGSRPPPTAGPRPTLNASRAATRTKAPPW